MHVLLISCIYVWVVVTTIRDSVYHRDEAKLATPASESPFWSKWRPRCGSTDLRWLNGKSDEELTFQLYFAYWIANFLYLIPFIVACDAIDLRHDAVTLDSFGYRHPVARYGLFHMGVCAGLLRRRLGKDQRHSLKSARGHLRPFPNRNEK